MNNDSSNRPPALVPSKDFWSRRENRQNHAVTFEAFGVPVWITANDPRFLEAARLSKRRFSRGRSAGSAPMRLRMVRLPAQEGERLPRDLPDRLVYSGVDDRIMISAGNLGCAFGDLGAREACVFLADPVVADPGIVSRYFIDHYITNFLFTEWAMLHASCVVDSVRGRLVILVAPHNAGKSTTALRLAEAGFDFLADGMVLLRLDGDRLTAGGYPIGEVRLRDDVLARFPELTGERIPVREHEKTIVDLRAVDRLRIRETTMEIESVDVLCVRRTDGQETSVEPISTGEASGVLAGNTVYWDEPSRLRHNEAILRRLLERARLHRMHLGWDVERLVAAVRNLPGGRGP